jgi:hypothetical protein
LFNYDLACGEIRRFICHIESLLPAWRQNWNKRSTLEEEFELNEVKISKDQNPI